MFSRRNGRRSRFARCAPDAGAPIGDTSMRARWTTALVALLASGQTRVALSQARPAPTAASSNDTAPRGIGPGSTSATSRPRGQRWAVVVGISRYRDSSIIPLKYADADAKAFHDFLTSPSAGPGGFPSKNTRLLLNADATYKNIRSALWTFLKRATDDDQVVIYFAGHGAPDPDRPDELYLLPFDTEGSDIAGSALRMADVREATRRVFAHDLLIIVDACHSAGVSGQAGRRGIASENRINDAFLKQLAGSSGGVAVFTASEASQVSREGPEWGGHGIFTHYVLDALHGAADTNSDSIVTLREMMEWVRDTVRRETNNAQNPSISQTVFDPGWPLSVVVSPTRVTSASATTSNRAADGSTKSSKVVPSVSKGAFVEPNARALNPLGLYGALAVMTLAFAAMVGYATRQRRALAARSIGRDGGRETVERGGSPGVLRPDISRRRGPIPAWAMGVGVVSIAAASAAAVLTIRSLRSDGGAATTLDPTLIAVLPFRVPVGDTALRMWRDGIPEVLSTFFDGVDVPRAVDQATLVRARSALGLADAEEFTPDTAVLLAKRVGAGQLLTGQLITMPNGTVRLTVRMVDVQAGSLLPPAQVDARPDSLQASIQQVMAQLLARRAGEPEQRLAALLNRPWPALVAYLSGQRAYRQARYAEAADDFEKALTIDPTFGLAAFGLRSASVFGSEVLHAPALGPMWDARNQFGPVDRAYVEAEAGARWPDVTPIALRLNQWEKALELAPMRPDVWFKRGDRIFHDGFVVERTDAHERAAADFRRALELDPSFIVPIQHLLQIVARENDTLDVRRLAAQYLAADSTSETSQYVRWRAAVATADTVLLQKLRANFKSFSVTMLRGIVRTTQEDGVALADAERAAEVLAAKAGLDRERADALRALHSISLNRGNPKAALHALEQMAASLSRDEALETMVLDALVSDGDSAAADRGAQELASAADARTATDTAQRASQYDKTCVVSAWRLQHGDTTKVKRGIERLRAARYGSDAGGTAAAATVCAAMLDAMAADVEKSRDAPLRLARLDSLLVAGTWIENMVRHANLIAAALHEKQGDHAGALRAVRRRIYFAGWSEYMSSYLIKQARLAAALNHRDEAVAAYRHYLVLRGSPEPSAEPLVERARAEYTALALRARP